MSYGLCCVCAEVRTVKISRGSAYRPPGFSYEDRTCPLKCRHCGVKTLHAVTLTDADHEDWKAAHARWVSHRRELDP